MYVLMWGLLTAFGKGDTIRQTVGMGMALPHDLATAPLLVLLHKVARRGSRGKGIQHITLPIRSRQPRKCWDHHRGIKQRRHG